MGDEPRRRATDVVPPEVILAIEDVAGRNRKTLRNEFVAAIAEIAGRLTSLETQVAANTLQSTREHTEVKAELQRVGRGFEALEPLTQRVTELEERDHADHAVAAALKDVAEQSQRNADRIRNAAIGLAMLIVTLTLGVAALLLQH